MSNLKMFEIVKELARFRIYNKFQLLK